MTDELIAFKGEIQLLSWSESHKGGRTGVFLFDEEDPDHPMKQFTTKKGKRAGQRFACVLVEIGDDEKPIPQEKKGGPLSISAARMCANQVFIEFIRERFQHWNEIGIDDAVRGYCGVESRAELDHNPDAAKRFHDLMKEFNQWRTA